MQRMKLAGAFALVLVALVAAQPFTGHVSTGSPVTVWQTAVADAKTATASPYEPSTVSASMLPMGNATGLTVAANYVGTLTTAPVVYVWGWDGRAWCALPTSAGSQSITLSSAASDCVLSSGKRTVSLDKIDAMGCTHVAVTVGTAAVASGAVSIQVKTF